MAANSERWPVARVAANKNVSRMAVHDAVKAGHLTGEWFGTMRMIVVNKAYDAWMPRPYGKHRREECECDSQSIVGPQCANCGGSIKGVEKRGERGTDEDNLHD